MSKKDFRMKKYVNSKATQRALAGLVSAALVSSGMGIVSTVPAFAETDSSQCAQIKARPSAGGVGQIQIEGADTHNFQPGGTLRIVGTDMVARGENGYLALKINFNGNQWNHDAQNTQDASGLSTATPGQTDAEDSSTQLYIPAEKFQDGNLDVTVVLPEDLKDGKNFITLLGGGDGGDRASESIPFLVNSAQTQDGHCGTLVSQESTNSPEITSVSGSAVDGHRSKAGVVSVGLEVPELSAGAKPTITVDGTSVPVDDKTVVGEDGTLRARVNLPKNSAPAGVHKLTVSTGDITKDLTLVTQAYAAISNYASRGASTTVSVVNLPQDAMVTGVGTQGQNWIPAPVTATDGTATLEGVVVPEDAPWGEQVLVTYEIDGQSYTATTGTSVNVSANTNNEQDYEIKTLKVASGLYQSAINNETKELFVTRAGFKPQAGTIYKVDAESLTLKQTKEIEAQPGEQGAEAYAPFGIGLDNQRGLIWVSNTLKNTVSVYRQSDLSLVKHWDEGLTAHPRDIVVDEDTGKAYVSSVGRTESYISVYDLEENTTEKIDIPGITVMMSLEYDRANKVIYSTSRNQPKVIKVDLNNNNAVSFFDMPADVIESASGVALDTKHQKLYIAAQGTGNVVVLGASDGSFLKNIPTGAVALSARYNAADDRVYVAHRGDGSVVAIQTSTDEVVAKLPAGALTNHLTIGADGTVFAVNKAAIGEPGQQQDEIMSFKNKDIKAPGTPGGTNPGSSQGGTAPGKDNSSLDNGMLSNSGLPQWAIIVLSIISSVGMISLMIEGLKHLAPNFRIPRLF